jgi:NADH:ubiquinone oxidoreductase subunit 4 (subunit M)
VDSEQIDMSDVHEAPWYEMYPMFSIVLLAIFFGIFPHYLMDPISVACYDILNFMGAI